MHTSREKVAELVARLTRVHGFDEPELFQASSVAGELNISRSLASSYLNSLTEEGVLVKVETRPTLFFDRGELERRLGMPITQYSFVSVAELLNAADTHRHGRYDFQDVIGAYGSLREILESLRAAASYPPAGIPAMLLGRDEEGKTELRTAMCRWCASELLVDDATPLTIRVASDGDTPKLVALLSGDDDAVADPEVPSCIVWVLGCEHLSASSWQKVLAVLGREGSESQRPRAFFDWSVDSEARVPDEVTRRIPVICRYPKFSARPADEREAYVYSMFQGEERQLSRKILVNMSVVKALMSLDSPEGTTAVRQAARMACASALEESRHSHPDRIEVFPANLPPSLVSAYVDTLDGEEALVDVEAYNPQAKSAAVFEAMASFLESVEELPSTGNEGRAETFHLLAIYFDRLSSYGSGRVRPAVEWALGPIVDETLGRNGLNDPLGFVGHLAACITFLGDNRFAAADWRQQHARQLEVCSRVESALCFREREVIDGVAASIRDVLGYGLGEEARQAFSFYLYWSIGNERPLCTAVIVAHGDSTASSMASAVNTMLRHRVFDAIDMPLEISSDEVVSLLDERLSKASVRQDLLVMVDMGSLEAIKDRLNNSLGVDVGVIDNVSTAPALEAGSLILDGSNVADILSAVHERTTCSCALRKGSQGRDTILFVSENGVGAASRLSGLFMASLPKACGFDAVSCDLFAVHEQVEGGTYEGRHILLAIGTSDPGLSGVRFVPLEDIIAADGETSSLFDLDPYLTSAEQCEFHANLVRSFSLESIMRYLTILEPDHLMDVVSRSIEQLQKNLGMHFSNRMLMRLYVHISYLVERLVTHHYLDDASTSGFEHGHADFVRDVRASFRDITSTYGVDLPMGEIHYVHQLIGFKESGKGASGSEGGESFFDAD